MNKPNMLLVVVDQWRGDFLPTTEQEWLALPNIRALMDDGVTFENHFSNAAPCGPARASILAGMYAMNHRVVQNKVPMDVNLTNLGEELRRAGHFSALVGYTSWMPDPSTTTPADPRYRGFGSNMPGWTVFESTEEPDLERFYGYLAENGYDIPEQASDIFSAETSDLAAPSRIDRAHSDSAWASNAALRFLRGRRDKPWALHLCYWRPHPPFVAPSPFHETFADTPIPAPIRPIPREDYAAQHPFIDLALRRTMAEDFAPAASGPTAHVDEPDMMKIRRQYFGLMAELDEQLGRVIDYLKETGQYDRTLIVLTSDHGEMLGDHYLMGKETYHSAAYHVPMIIRDPRPEARAFAGRAVSKFTESVDIMPTILDWMDLPIPTQVDGESLIPFTRGEDPANWRKAAHFEYDFRHLSTAADRKELGISVHECGVAVLRDERFEYVHFTALPPLLFDLQGEGGEHQDVSRLPEYRDVLLDYAQRLLTMRMRHASRRLTSFTASPDGLIRLQD